MSNTNTLGNVPLSQKKEEGGGGFWVAFCLCTGQNESSRESIRLKVYTPAGFAFMHKNKLIFR